MADLTSRGRLAGLLCGASLVLLGLRMRSVFRAGRVVSEAAAGL